MPQVLLSPFSWFLKDPLHHFHSSFNRFQCSLLKPFSSGVKKCRVVFRRVMGAASEATCHKAPRDRLRDNSAIFDQLATGGEPGREPVFQKVLSLLAV